MDGFPLVHYHHRFSLPFTYCILGNLSVNNLPSVVCVVPSSLRFDLEKFTVHLFLESYHGSCFIGQQIDTKLKTFFFCYGLSYIQLGVVVLFLHIE